MQRPHSPLMPPPPDYGTSTDYHPRSPESEFPPSISAVNESSLSLLPAIEDDLARPYVSTVPRNVSTASRAAIVGSMEHNQFVGRDSASRRTVNFVAASREGSRRDGADLQSRSLPSPTRSTFSRVDAVPSQALDRSYPPVTIKITSLPRTSAPLSSTSPRRSYQPAPTVGQTPSRTSSFRTTAIPVMPPPAQSNAPPYSQYSPQRAPSPTRPWSPSRIGAEWRKPPPPSNVAYENIDLNGAPRPGTPASAYGSPRRPLPPAPLFAKPNGASPVISFEDSDETAIPITTTTTTTDENDPFAPSTIDPRQSLKSSHSFQSESTSFDPDHHHHDDIADEKADEFGEYHAVPSGRQERRGARQALMSRKEVKLINGELILECKIPTILYSFLPRRDEIEFTHMRYTAVTCDPDEFVERGYLLRQNIAKRETELFVCVTMYNEAEIDFTRTMHGVMKNIAHFCSRTRSRVWGKDGWEKIVICIVADGRRKVHARTLDALAAMGCFQPGIAKNLVNQKEVTAHVYEYTTQVSLDADLKFKGAEKGIVPAQLIFCMKEKNQKKLNSHRWFFNAFGKALNPNVCILLDVGTRPGKTSLYHLWKAFDQDSNVAGACGEIKAMTGRHGRGLLNPLVASQNFEYKMSNILDKPLESVFGYITVLPGALSAYRYHALQNDHTGHGPLSQYFKGETLKGNDADVFTANMYLAEDRILCWELVAKRSERWVLKYVRAATGETDVPDAVPEFISQRRRWLNGAFFAAVYSLIHFRQVWKTDHTLGRKILLHIEFVYQFVSLLFTFFSLANFYLTFYFIAGSLSDPKLDPFGHSIGLYLFTLLRFICITLIGTQFILSMGNRPQGAKKMYLASLIIYSVIMAYTTFCALYIVVSNFKRNGAGDPDPSLAVNLGDNVFTNLIVSTCSTVGLYFLMSFMYADPWHMFTSSAQYFALLPSYICTLQVYAFCNTHDVSWGTKGDNTIHTDLGSAAAAGKGANANTVQLDMPSEQLDIDSGYDESLRNLRDRIAIPVEPPSEGQQQEDYYRAVRTYMVVVWMVANAVLAMAVSEAYNVTDGSRAIGGNFYLKFILWAVAAVALFRALGSTTYIVLNAFQAVLEGRIQQWVGRWRIPGLGGRGGTLGEKIGSRGSVWSGGGRSWGSRSIFSKGASGGGSWFGKGSGKGSAGGTSSLGRSEGVWEAFGVKE